MAKMALAQAIEQELKNKNVNKSTDGKFGGTVRNMDAGDPLATGDIITIPTEFEILTVKLSEDRPAVPFIMVETKNELDPANEKNVRFFPNQLAKIVFPVDADGKRLPKVKTTGTAAKLYAGFQNIDDAMNALKGKSIKVSKDDTYRTERFSDKQIVNTHIYQYDLVEG